MVHKRMRVVCTGMIYSHTRELKRKKRKRWLNSVRVAVSSSWRDNKNIEKKLPNLQKSLKYKKNAKSTGCRGITVKASKPRPSKEGMKNGKKRPELLLNSRWFWFCPWFLCLVPTNCSESPGMTICKSATPMWNFWRSLGPSWAREKDDRPHARSN